MDTKKDFLNYFHTNLRNVGLFTSIAIALQAYSSRLKTQERVELKSLVVYFSHLLFLILAVILNYFLIQEFADSEVKDEIEKWIIIPKVAMYFLISILLYNTYTFCVRAYSYIK